MYVIGSRMSRSRYCGRLNVQSVNCSLKGKARVSRYSSRYEIDSNTRLSDRLFSQAQDIGMQVIKHPFHKEMVEGTLCKTRFERFIVQDILYLEGCIRSFEIAKHRFPKQSDLFELLISDTRVEIDKHMGYRSSLEIDKDLARMNQACEEYINFLGSG